MTRFSSPPKADARIFPSPLRRLGFAGIGLLAVGVRAATARRRASAWAAAQPTPPIFIYEPFGMGDIIALQPLVRAWLAFGRRVTLAARPAWAAIIPPHPTFTFCAVSPAYARPDSQKSQHRLPHELRSLGARLHPQAAGAIGIDVRGDVRSIILLYLAGCGTVRTLPRYHTANDCRVPKLAATRVPLLRGVTRRVVNSAFNPPETNAARPSLGHLLPKAGVIPDIKRIGLIPLTPWAGKRWEPEYWRETILRLLNTGLHPIVLCGPGETDAARSAVAAERLPVECREADSVIDWVRHIAKCGAVISVNTGPMHIADALDRPLVVLDGPSRLPLWAPEGEHAHVIHHQGEVDCAPCHPAGDGAACGRHCMRLIRPDEVLSALGAV